MYTYRALQHGRNPSIEGPPKKRRLDDESGPKGCIHVLYGSDTKRTETSYAGINATSLIACHLVWHAPLGFLVAPLFYRSLQDVLGRPLTTGAQDYSVSVEVTPNMREELQWWEDHCPQWNGRTPEKLSVVMETDASKRGWGDLGRDQSPTCTSTA